MVRRGGRPLAFTRDDFLARRPWLYHFTTPQNVDLLRSERAMLSAAAWVVRANAFRPQIEDPYAYLGAPRLQSRMLEIDHRRTVTLNDQLPIQHPKQCNNLQGTYSDFLRCLNGYVFFWPGTDERPRPTGNLASRFAARYAAFGLVRVLVAPLWHRRNSPIRFCRYNSGAPQARTKAPRGPQIFVTCDAADYDERGVAEVVFPNRVDLPPDTQWRPPGEGSTWEPLFVPVAAAGISPG